MFLVTNFKKDLFHFSYMFGMFDAPLDHEDEERLNFERQIGVREAQNVIACEEME